mmetsp:Transcript_84853/g.235297  ORF Transcript_84853/g.235297 Transcript_84853/m.235297 type:complete len:286 (+) Transcript_84853:407-1264(+)
MRPICGEDQAYVARVVRHDMKAFDGRAHWPAEVGSRRDALGEVLQRRFHLLYLRMRVELQHADGEVHAPGGHEYRGVDAREALKHHILAEPVNELAELGIMRQRHREEVCVIQFCLLLLTKQLDLGLAAVDLLLLPGAQPDCILLIFAMWDHNSRAGLHLELLFVARARPHNELVKHSWNGQLEDPLIALVIHLIIQLPFHIVLLIQVCVMACCALELKVFWDHQLTVRARAYLHNLKLGVLDILSQRHEGQPLQPMLPLSSLTTPWPRRRGTPLTDLSTQAKTA